MNVWAELGLEAAVRDEAAVRRAYALRLKAIDRSDPEAFGRLRDAYGRALALAAQAGAAEEDGDEYARDDEDAYGGFEPDDRQPPPHDGYSYDDEEDDWDPAGDRRDDWARVDAFIERFHQVKGLRDPAPALAALDAFLEDSDGFDFGARNSAEDWLFRLAAEDGRLHTDVLRALVSRFNWTDADSLPARYYTAELDELLERLEAYAFLAELQAGADALTPDMPPGAPERIAAALLGMPQPAPELPWRERFLHGRATAWTRHPSLAEVLARAERFFPYLRGRIYPKVLERMKADYVGPAAVKPAPKRNTNPKLRLVIGAVAAFAVLIGGLFVSGALSPQATAPDGRRVLEMTEGSWLAFVEGSGPNPRLYFTHLLSYRGALKEIRYGLDGPPDRVFPFPPAPETELVAPIGVDTPSHIDVPPETRFATAEITYKDGRRAGPVTFVRGGDLGADGAVVEFAPGQGR